jgi:hypothetical protein
MPLLKNSIYTRSALPAPEPAETGRPGLIAEANKIRLADDDLPRIIEAVPDTQELN